MKLFGAGLPRTGTLSQKIAIEALGLAPCYHMVNVLGDLDQAVRWRGVLDGEISVQEIFDGFPATVDWPGSFFWKEAIEAFPEAKVLLSVRDGDTWAQSMHDTIWGMLYGDILIRDLSSARTRVDPQWNGFIEMVKEMWLRSGLLDGERTTLGSMATAMRAFNAEVERTVPSERLLVWSVADGWEPLCEFLEVPVPDMPFPHVNDSVEFEQRMIDGSVLAVQQYRAATDEHPAGAAV